MRKNNDIGKGDEEQDEKEGEGVGFECLHGKSKIWRMSNSERDERDRKSISCNKFKEI